MQLEHIAGIAFDHIFRPLLRRALLALLMAAFAVVALYHFTIAGTLALEAQYGVLQAQLVVAAIYSAFALLTLAIWWAIGRRPTSASSPALAAPREMQMAMLVEAVMLGYQMGKKRERAS